MQTPVGGDAKKESKKEKFLAKEKVVEPVKVDGNGNGSKGKGKGCFKCVKENRRIGECPLWAKNGAATANTLQVEEMKKQSFQDGALCGLLNEVHEDLGAVSFRGIDAAGGFVFLSTR
ncbi:OLC1v1024548C1 [Oldenlandia corymbosa var. corymbosa]|uniref:OLC1v1024548C1 n=1 Tax=Oldenlandia corymbosa var. corymbosa TaxID=529605 RepID=A0AAV1C631_OLDCO|nr:OLC1v1024548C1 [Oldenlandia corymbosa var. corymbosa]